mgnify:CR=1 FL=1
MAEKVKTIVKLQIVVLIYTFASIFAKLASGEKLFSLSFCFFTGMELLVLFLYAMVWQQVMKKTELTVAYANREMYLLWSLLWAVVFFQNKITFFNVIGCIFVIIGTVLITSEGTPEDTEVSVADRAEGEKGKWN